MNTYSTQTNINFDILYNCSPGMSVSPVPVQPTPFVPFAQVQQPFVTQAIHNETLKLLSKADDMSSEILRGQKKSSQSYHPQVIHPAPVVTQPAPINISFVDRSFRMFNNDVNHHHGNDNKKDDNSMRVLVGVIGLIVAGITAFCIGKAMAEDEDIEEENISFEVLKASWNINKINYDYDYQTTADEIVRRADTIMQRQQTNRTHKVALLAFGFIGGGTAVAGALVGSTAAMTVAAAIGACVIVAGLFKLGYACFSTRDQKDAEAIDRSLTQLSQKTIFVV